MFDNPADSGATTAKLEGELLRSLERQKGEAIASQRLFARVDARIKVAVRPADSSQSARPSIAGTTADISRGGCRLLLPVPIGVGDHYRLEFESTEHPLPLTFARCTRCQLVREDAFEAGLQFAVSIDLPPSLYRPPSDLLG